MEIDKRFIFDQVDEYVGEAAEDLKSAVQFEAPYLSGDLYRSIHVEKFAPSSYVVADGVSYGSIVQKDHTIPGKDGKGKAIPANLFMQRAIESMAE